LVLYRILGNDLPPLHAPGRSLANLLYILRHEPDLPGLEKRWLLNRIVSPEAEAELLSLIREAGHRVDVIPYRRDACRGFWTDIGRTPEAWHPWNEGFAELDPLDQARTVDYIARHKHRCLINLNDARNQAISLGLADADWVFPWDGGCFLPRHAWEVLRPLTSIDGLSYIAVPMVRLQDNDLLAGDPAVLSVQRHEPQLGFSRRAQLHFDPGLRYGAMSKAMLLRRIALPGPWQESLVGILPWECPDESPAPDAGAFVQAGVVFRLCGPGQENPPTNPDALESLRLDGIRRLSRRQELEALGRFLAAQPLRCWTVLADPALDPNAALPESLRQEVARRAALARSLPTRPESAGAGWLELPVDSICALALDHRLHGTPASLEQLRGLLRGWFLKDGSDQDRPDTGSGSLALPGTSLTEDMLLRLTTVYPLLDALTMVRMVGGVSPAELQGVESGVDSLLQWLCADSVAFLCTHQGRPVATCYHLLVLAVSAHLNRGAYCLQAIDNLPGLLARQFAPDGSPRAREAPPTIREQLLNLQTWADLAILCSCLGRDLMELCDDQGHGLQQVFRHAHRELLPQLQDPEDRAWAVWIEHFETGASSPTDRWSIPSATALPPFPALCRRLVPIAPEPLTEDDPERQEQAHFRAGGTR
jgi:hypothetical protein